MPQSFGITFKISEEEWRRTATLKTQRESEPIFDAFYGQVGIQKNGEELFPKGSCEISVADLVLGLCEILYTWVLDPNARAEAKFSQADDALEIYFKRDESDIIVSCNIESANTLRVANSEFAAGVMEFIKRFCEETEKQVPRGLEWGDLIDLKPCFQRLRNQLGVK